jgi:hypothetical protein
MHVGVRKERTLRGNHTDLPVYCLGWKQKGNQDGKSCFAAGAVYILFMNVDGTVKYHRKISARSGNLLLGPQCVFGFADVCSTFTISETLLA